jgi:oxygen-dependent protoporphyrinogen oxidase
VGGGIAGLAAAWELRGEAELTVFEPDRLGGRILTTIFEGRPVDEGPDAFITRAPDALELCREAGIEADLIVPAAGRALVWFGGHLRPIPEGLVLGAPRQLGGVLHSRILTPAGVARAACDLVLPRGRPPATLTVRELVASRFGAQVADRLVDPLVGGIHAGSTAHLGAAEVTPMLVSAAERSRSLLLGLRQGPTPDGSPMFAAPRDGLGQLVDAMVAKLRTEGTHFVPELVERVRAAPRHQIVVSPDPEPYDAAVIATPAAVTKSLLDIDGVEDLGRVRTASVAVVTMAVDGLVTPAGYSGFLIPRGEGRLMTACSFASNKWPHWADTGRSVLRVSAGRDGDRTALELDDDRLVGRLAAELGQALGTEVSPATVRVSRWPDAFPQYLVGHGRRMAAIEKAVSAALPTVALAGASYYGSGLPACIASGRRAARAVLAATGRGDGPQLHPGRSPGEAVSLRPEAR